MIRVYFKKLENGNLEITQDMLTDILSHMKRQDKEKIKLNNIIEDLYDSIHHELHGHILNNDEDSWLPKFYTNNKLDYRKLLIDLLSDYENRLNKGIGLTKNDKKQVKWLKEEFNVGVDKE